ncbi:MAG TPA: helix-turn-helix transcriptional regulator [Hanamia sp.]|nr:helix-turn-helix transcriptional regulator [Hanamia sp.]
MTTNEMKEKVHQGRNVKRFREMLGIKQDALAIDLGDDWNQQKVSLLEQKETIDDDLLQQISDVLKVPVEAIKNFDEEKAFNIISNTFTSQDSSTLNAINYYPTFNPIDKIVELYDALVKSEKEKWKCCRRCLMRRNKKSSFARLQRVG